MYRSTIILFVIALLAPSSRSYADPKSDMDEARKHWRELDFELVVRATDRVLAQRSSRNVRLEALRLKGSALIVLDRPAEAVAIFDRIFDIEPEYELPDDVSPRIAEVFEPAKAAWQVKVQERLATELGDALGAFKMSVWAEQKIRGGQPLVVEVSLVDPGHIAARVVLTYRRRGRRSYSTIAAKATSAGIKLTVPPSFTATERPQQLEYYVRVLHSSGATLRRHGSADHPVRVAVTPGQIPRATPITKKWWFWTGVGAVVVSSALLVRAATDAGPQIPRFREAAP